MSIADMGPYISLMKLRIGLLVVVTTAIGYFMARGQIESWGTFALTLFGTFLSSSGAAALNNYLERDIDARMYRTRLRPLPSGKLSATQALMFGLVLTLLGVGLLCWQVNLLTGFLALLTSFLYVLVYTPLKRVTWLNTMVGAIPGALPPVGGWAAAEGSIGAGAWILFLIMFIWQQPHFYAIAWMYRDDYRAAGFKMLPVVDSLEGTRTFRQVMMFSWALIPASLLPLWFGSVGWLYAFGAIVLGGSVLMVSTMFSRSKSIADARRLLRTTIVYLPLMLFLIVADVQFFG